MYTKGEAQVTLGTRDENGYPHQIEPFLDARHPDGSDQADLGPGVAFLPHSCQEWVIGGPKEVKAMIEDLQEILKAQENEVDMAYWRAKLLKGLGLPPE
jgi:hypothetical protein